MYLLTMTVSIQETNSTGQPIGGQDFGPFSTQQFISATNPQGSDISTAMTAASSALSPIVTALGNQLNAAPNNG